MIIHNVDGISFPHKGIFTRFMAGFYTGALFIIALFDSPTIHTRLKGQLLDHLGNPVPEAEITITSLTHTNTGLTNEEGNYNLLAKSGTYHVAAKKNNQLIYEKHNLKIKQGQITHLDITLPNA